MKADTRKLFIGNKAKRVWLSGDQMLENKEDAKKFGFAFGGIDHNGDQVYINTQINARLSDTEREVFVVSDLPDSEIADKLGISEKTVEAYRKKIEKKGIAFSVGGKIAFYREQAGLFQADLASKVGITQEHLSRIENGRYMPRVDIVKKMADVLGCKVDDLI